jgi:hypothetical protein
MHVPVAGQASVYDGTVSVVGPVKVPLLVEKLT